jgi:S-formylglutathione hydrolase FrmB
MKRDDARRRDRRRRALMVAAGALAGSFAAPAIPATAHTGGLQYVGTTHPSARLQELTFSTAALGGQTKVRVLLPSGYDAAPRARYPVLYLLHGAGENQTAWTTSGDVERVTSGHPLIVVMPEGGPDGGYTNWYNWGAGGPPEWETYHIEQLIPWIDAHFRTIASRAGRAIAGVSMGGGGSMHYAADHPDMFVAAAEFSGAVDNTNLFMQPLGDATGVVDGKPPASACGLWQTEEVRCRGINAVDLAENVAGLSLVLDTGDGLPGGPNGNAYDPVENGVYQQNVAFHERLAQLGIAHVWNYYGHGDHSYYYFDRDLTLLLPRLMQVFADPPPPPVPFEYTSIATDYGIYGWRVKVDRPALEFSELRGVGRHGFELHGSGTAVVTTAAYYRPGQALVVGLRNLNGNQVRLVRADRAGRLSLTLTLGPGNPYQEYSLQAKSWLATRDLLSNPGQEQGTDQNWPVYAATVTIRSLAAARRPAAAPRPERARAA